MHVKPAIIFDTSALNRLLDDPDTKCLVAGLQAGFFIRITGLNILEIAATRKPERRKALLLFCRSLGEDFICPWNEIIKSLIAAYQTDRSYFDWKSVNVEWPRVREELSRMEIFTDEIAEGRRAEAKEQESNFRAGFAEGERVFKEIFDREPKERFSSFREVVEMAQASSGGMWKIASNIYERRTQSKTYEEMIREFVAACPPFATLLLATCAASYEHWIRKAGTAESYRAGIDDLFSAVYLPYCDKFVTHDDRQFNALKSLASLQRSDLGEVLLYEEFRGAFDLAIK